MINKKIKVTMSIDPEIKRKALEILTGEGRKLSTFVELVLKDYINKNGDST